MDFISKFVRQTHFVQDKVYCSFKQRISERKIYFIMRSEHCEVNLCLWLSIFHVRDWIQRSQCQTVGKLLRLEWQRHNQPTETSRWGALWPRMAPISKLSQSLWPRLRLRVSNLLLWRITHNPLKDCWKDMVFIQNFISHSTSLFLFFYPQNVVSRVTNLPLVSSACEVVSKSYTSTKDSMPLLKGVMDAAESGVRTLGAAATTGSKPLLDIIEPQRRFFLCVQ